MINIVTLIFICIFVFPVLIGAFESFSRQRLHHSMASLFQNIEFLLGIFLSIYLTRKIFFDHDNSVFKQIYDWIPEMIKTTLYGKDIFTYLVSVPFVLFIVLIVIRTATNPIYKYLIYPLSEKLYDTVSYMHVGFRRFLGALWQLPKSVYLVFLFGLFLNFYTYYYNSPTLVKWMNDSSAYQALYKNAIYPALNSNIAKKVPVIVNDYFRNTSGSQTIRDAQPGEYSIPGQSSNSFGKGNIRVIEYFNGVTLDEAIKSTPEMDDMARRIVGAEKDDKKKAYLLYKWVSENVEYDFDKAVRVSSNPRGASSGSIVAFNTRKGICFDYSCLYISMCHAVGVKVQLVTGLAYSGTAWGDHAWNRAFYPNENRWINVDTTFGTVANYFDKTDFNVDHKDSEIQGEW